VSIALGPVRVLDHPAREVVAQVAAEAELLTNRSNRPHLFADGLQQSLGNALTWIHGADRSKLVCANCQHRLLRDNSHTSWAKADFERFLSASIELWNNWK
jgi:hypothetical protein